MTEKKKIYFKGKCFENLEVLNNWLNEWNHKNPTDEYIEEILDELYRNLKINLTEYKNCFTNYDLGVSVEKSLFILLQGTVGK